MLNLNDWSPPSAAQPMEHEVVAENRNEMLESPSSLVIDLIARENESVKTDVTTLKPR